MLGGGEGLLTMYWCGFGSAPSPAGEIHPLTTF